MELYYKSLANAKISTPTEQKSSIKQYSLKEFQEWVEKVDILDLEKEAINFAAADTIVTGFGDYRCEVGRNISREFKYEYVSLPGEMKNIGSCWDGSKVGKMNEVDSLYVMENGPFTIKPSKRPGSYHVIIKKRARECEVKPREFRDHFADQYSQTISQINLPDCLNHGGYNSFRYPGQRSAYSGLRYNGPAATSQFLTDEKSLLTWDMTPCIELADKKIETKVREIIHPILAQNPTKLFPNTPLHLIPDPLEHLWVISTAYLEAELLRYLSEEAPVKKALMVCKILCSLLKSWNLENKEHTASTSQGIKVMKQLIRHLESNKLKNEDMERLMRFAHIWLPSDKRAEYNEDEKSEISINTAAVKHIIIRAGLEEEGAFAPTHNEDLVLKLVKVVFQTLGNDQDFASDHAFLSRIRIFHFSMLVSNASGKVALARSVCQQCRILLSGAMTEVGLTSTYYADLSLKR